MSEFNIADLFRKPANQLEPGGVPRKPADDREQCPRCKQYFPRKRFEKNLRVCPSCGHHQTLPARRRLEALCAGGSFCELFSDITARDFLNFPNYEDKLKKARDGSGENEGVVCGTGVINGVKCALFAMEPGFMMGSMGSAVGERITRTFEYATLNRLPVVGFTASGGARMQEGIISLMQMAKISGAIQRHGEAGCFYLAVLTNPTTGGVTASFAMLGDIILAEPKALVGFAGKRVIEQTTKSKLAADFQSAEFVLKHGFLDAIVERKQLAEVIGRLLKQHTVSEKKI